HRDALVEPEPQRTRRLVGVHERSLAECLDARERRRDRSAKHGARALEGEASVEYRERRERFAFGARELLPRRCDRTLEHACAVNGLVDHLEDLLLGERRQSRRSELDRERIAVEAPHDRRDGAELRARWRISTTNGARAEREKPNAVV